MSELNNFRDSTWRGYRSYYCDGYNYDVYDREYRLKEENFNLRLQLENSEKTIDDYIFRENELSDRIGLLEAQKANLEEKLYRIELYRSQPPKEEDLLLWENRRLKDLNLKSELKLELLTHFINKLQTLTSRKEEKSGFTILENMELSALREKLKQVENEIVKLFEYRNEKEAQKGLVMGNSEIINKNLKDLSEENENLKKKIDALNINYNKPESQKTESQSTKTRISHPVSNDELLMAVNRLTQKVQSIDEDLKRVNGGGQGQLINPDNISRTYNNSEIPEDKKQKTNLMQSLLKPKSLDKATNPQKVETPKTKAKEKSNKLSSPKNQNVKPQKEEFKSIKSK